MKLKTNLFGWNPNGKKETSKLITLLLWDSRFKLLFEGHGTIYLEAPFPYQEHARCVGPMVYLCDNGGEVNVGYVNRVRGASVPSTWNSINLNAETMYYRIKQALMGEPIDYGQIDEPWFDDWAKAHKKQEVAA